MKKVLVILGPTASGKSALGVRLAKKFKGEIISADSRQVYKGLNIGTGKITKKEMGGIPHHLLNILEPKKIFDASQYKSLAEDTLEKILEKKKLPIVVGGTGFYIDTLAGNVVLPEVKPNLKLREKLGKKTPHALFKLLKMKDPVRAKSIHPNNKVRLIRALEIISELGSVPPLQKLKSDKKFIYLGLKPENLEKRIRVRLIQRMPGMISEAKRLLSQKKLTHKRMHELGLEYRYLSLYLKKELSKEEMLEALNTAIKKYAKRQMLWFKRNPKIKWFKADKLSEIEKYVKKALDLEE